MKTVLLFRKRCPLCATPLEFRIHREEWMRLLPRSRHYRCQYCGAGVLRFLNLVCIRVSWPGFKTIRPEPEFPADEPS